MVLDLGPDRDGGLPRLYLGGRERAPLLYVHRSGLHQPHVPVDPGALVKPAVAQGRIDAHQQHIRTAGKREIRQVEAEGIVAAAVPADVVAVEDHHRFPIGAVELDRDPPARIGRRDVEDAAVPAHAGLGVVASQRVGSLARQRGVVLEGQRNRPVVGQVHRCPLAVVVGQVAGGEKAAGLLETARPAGAETEVLRGVVCVTEVEAPAEIQQRPFAQLRCRRRRPRRPVLGLRCGFGHSDGGCRRDGHAGL